MNISSITAINESYITSSTGLREDPWFFLVHTLSTHRCGTADMSLDKICFVIGNLLSTSFLAMLPPICNLQFYCVSPTPVSNLQVSHFGRKSHALYCANTNTC